MDRDETPIGGLANPLQPTRQLFIITVIMDVIALILSLFNSYVFTVGILIYILASRAYSYRGIRLKRFPVIGFLVVFICQGALIFIITTIAIAGYLQTFSWLDAIISSLLIGALYPLTQIYQHEQDRNDGVISLSYRLGKQGTFIFSMILFLLATFLLFIRFKKVNQLSHFLLFTIIMLPVLIYFLNWQFRVIKKESEANYTNSLKMNVIATLCTTIYFSILICLH
jgi:1,4-dihydroxy-2-naphthoate polyprenyltransferase